MSEDELTDKEAKIVGKLLLKLGAELRDLEDQLDSATKVIEEQERK